MSAIIDGRYRYSLQREVAPLLEGDRLLFVMLNPSTADATQDDPTIRKCLGFSQILGFQRFEVVNLFAFRATDPRELARARADGFDVVGPLNDLHITEAARRCRCAVMAWGAFKLFDLAPRAREVLELVRAGGLAPQALAVTESGAPRHPLMLGYKEAALRPWPPPC